MLDGLEALKRKVDQLRANKEQAQGALNQLLKRIKEEFGCKNLQEAETKLLELEEEERTEAKEYSRVKERFERRHKEALSTLSVKNL